LEKIVASRLTDFLETNNLLAATQFGFRKEHSTLHPLIHFLNFVSNSNNKKKYAMAIFCDLQKAFDTVHHNTLLQKLKKVGIHGIELKWLNRHKFVSINGISGGLLNILLGVPQGSVLGPLLFLIYI
jgi:hypothetical protein